MKISALTPSAITSLNKYGLDPNRLTGCALFSFASGETIIEQGRPVERLFIIQNGEIKVCMLAKNGKDLILSYYANRGVLGDVELMQRDRAGSATSVAAIPAGCIGVPLVENEAYLLSNSAFLCCIARGLSDKLLSSGNDHIASALYSSESRLCSYILLTEHEGVFAEILSETAKSIGVSYRHLFRVLQTLCSRSVLVKTPEGYRIVNRGYLMSKSAR